MVSYTRFQLDYVKITGLLETLEHRVHERFEGREAGLVDHCRSLKGMLKEANRVKASISRPYYMLRFINLLLVVGLGVVLYFCVKDLKIDFSTRSAPELLQGLDSGKNLIVAVALVIFSLFYMEIRLKRRKAIRLLSEFKALAHVIGLAQQSKDPERLLYAKGEGMTKSSPELGATKTPFLLGRFLDYSMELLELLTSVATFLTEGNADNVVLESQNHLTGVVANISSGIGRKQDRLTLIAQELEQEKVTVQSSAEPLATAVGPKPDSASKTEMSRAQSAHYRGA